MTNIIEAKGSYKKNYEELSPEAKDLILFAEENPHIKLSMQPLLHKLAHQIKRGEYDENEARSEWSKHADKAAVEATKVHGETNDVWHKRYKKTHRNEAAAHWEAEHRQHLHHLHENNLLDEEKIIGGNMASLGSEEQKQHYYQMVKAIIDNQPIQFKSAFTGAFMPKLHEAIGELKQSIKETMFRDITEPEPEVEVIEDDDTNLNEISRVLLGKYVKKAKKETIISDIAARYPRDDDFEPDFRHHDQGINLALDKITNKSRVHAS